MEYKELCAFIKEKLGDVFYPLVGKLYKLYTVAHIKSCVLKIPSKKQVLSPKNKMIYLAGLCKTLATISDIKSSGNRISMNEGDLDI